MPSVFQALRVDLAEAAVGLEMSPKAFAEFLNGGSDLPEQQHATWRDWEKFGSWLRKFMKAANMPQA